MRPLARKLLAWYGRHGRDLPWRHTRDPYRIWVSEAMLQQTQVETVLPYYERFATRFPDLYALAAAPLDDVLKVWEGLGYYARARNLHKGAQFVVREYGGALPHNAEALRRIPGVGRYMAGAIASIAFGCDEATMDGNIRRVLARVCGVREDVREPAVQERLWAFARAVLPAGQAGDFNQALMDLGASICVARRPRCLLCPLTEECEAYQHGWQDVIPLKVPKPSKPHYTIAIGVIWKRGRILIQQRKPEGLLGGLWEFAGGKVEAGEEAADACRREIREELGIAVRVGEEFIAVEHGYTHFSVTIHAFRCEYVRGTPRPLSATRVRWVFPSQLSRFAWPAANRKIIGALSEAKSKRS